MNAEDEQHDTTYSLVHKTGAKYLAHLRSWIAFKFKENIPFDTGLDLTLAEDQSGANIDISLVSKAAIIGLIAADTKESCASLAVHPDQVLVKAYFDRTSCYGRSTIQRVSSQQSSSLSYFKRNRFVFG